MLTVLLSAFAGLGVLVAVAVAWLAVAFAIHRQKPELHLPNLYGQRLQSLRWFFLALLILHGLGAVWGPAGMELDSALSALRQVLVLMLLMLAVTVVLEPLAIPQRIHVFSVLLQPFTALGLDSQRTGAIMAVALSEAFELRAVLKERVNEAETTAGMSHTARAVDAVAQQCIRIEQGEGSAGKIEELPQGLNNRLTTVPTYTVLALLPLLALLIWQAVISFG